MSPADMSYLDCHMLAIPGYEPVESLAINGAFLYLARRSSDGEVVVIKVYHGRSEHLRHYDSLLARLDHPNIARVFEMGEFQKWKYCVLESIKENWQGA